MQNSPFTGVAEVGIVGAGTAGLAAALTLRRHRRSVVIFDGGPARNYWARQVHGVLGLPGISGQQLQTLGRQQVSDVGGKIVTARIDEAQRDGDGFVVCEADGRAWRVERVVLATGVRDTYPNIEGFFDFYGSSVFVCPHCDGYEVRDQPIALVTWSPSMLPFTLTLTQWTRRITIVTDGRASPLGRDDRDRLTEIGARVITKDVRRFEGSNGQLQALRFDDDTTLPVSAAFFAIEHTFRTALAERLGCRLRSGGCVDVDEHLRTSVDGVWAVGDVVGEEQLVPIASAHGVKAGVDIHRTLPLPTGELPPS
ncbi:MAG TPA: NAD(P)/FAD-dependent oxidoreductase [Chloroflexota bacterium]|nr:NAD(P)/FAD-dependent oxidoreductase [Chloroflexota bacterium]